MKPRFGPEQKANTMGALQPTRVSDRSRWHPLPTSASGRLPQPTFGTTGGNVASLHDRRGDQSHDVGVHLPFIAPKLWGVRVRAAPDGPEFTLPNPSGGRGVYVTSWNVVADFAAPSPHDILLVGRLSGLDVIGPADVRQAARSVALDGHAGHDACVAAQQAQAALDVASLRLRAQFLLTLARRSGCTAEDAVSCLDRSGFNALATRLGWRGTQLAEALQSLSVDYASVAVGIGGASAGSMASDRGRPRETGRWGRLRALVHRLRVSLAEEQCCRGGPDAILLGRIMNAADRCIQRVDWLLPEIQAMLADPLPLLEAWRDGLGRNLGSWLSGLEAAFDGWDRISLLWFDAHSPHARQSLIPEIAARARATGSGEGWTSSGSDGSPAAEDFWHGSALDGRRQLVLRNERIRAQELGLELAAA